MEELESQIAKICLGNTKSSNTYVYVLAESAEGVDDTELYVVAEMPLFNPAAEESCERICLAIASSLRRSYKNPGASASFENAISQINEELGKLAAMGQTQWVDKLNCILGIKEGANLSIASCGKVSAYLLRNKEYTDISCSPDQSHPLKTFENYATGKIRLGDLIILSTTQLFNYLSMDRLLDIVSKTDFLTATRTVIELLKENAEPQVSFGVLLNLQVPVGQTRESEVDLENYVVQQPQAAESFLNKVVGYIKTIFTAGKTPARVPQTSIPRISFGQKLKNFGGNTKNFVSRSKDWWHTAKTSAGIAGSAMRPGNLKNLSKQKKFFLISALVLLVAVAGNITLAIHLKKTKTANVQITGQLKDIQTLLSNTQASLLYKDDGKAADYLKQAQSKLPKANQVPASNKQQYQDILAQIADIQKQMEKIVTPQVTNLGSLGQSDVMLKLPNYAAAQVNKTIISYNKQNGKIEDGTLNSPVNILANIYFGGNSSAIYDGNALYMWDFFTGKAGAAFTQNVPQKADFGGLALYPTNNRLYVADKKSAQIVNFAVQKDTLGKPVVSVRDASLSAALDITIDSSIYVLTSSGISKFQSGKPAEFNMPSLATPFSGQGKIYTQKDFKYLYVLDAGNNRILILDKKGSLVSSLKSDSFTKLKDFQVDEKNKIVYVLNDGALLKVVLP